MFLLAENPTIILKLGQMLCCFYYYILFSFFPFFLFCIVVVLSIRYFKGMMKWIIINKTVFLQYFFPQRRPPPPLWLQVKIQGRIVSPVEEVWQCWSFFGGFFFKKKAGSDGAWQGICRNGITIEKALSLVLLSLTEKWNGSSHLNFNLKNVTLVQKIWSPEINGSLIPKAQQPVF